MENQEKFAPAFTNRIKTQLGNEFSDFMQSLSEEAPTSIRINERKSSPRLGEPIPWCTSGRYLKNRPSFTLDPTFHGGAYYVQEASSMFLERVLSGLVDTSKPLRVLDACAAPGGKSTHLLSLITENSLLVSNEVIRSRASILSENIQKWGYPNVVVTNNDPADFKSLSGFFDVIIVDAPCSGEGLFRKDPAAAAEWSEKNVELCSLRQRRIVADLWPSLKEDGILIYSTCTYNSMENEDNLDWISKTLQAVPEKIEINPHWNIKEVHKNNLSGYQFFPHRTKGEGFFIGALRKKEVTTGTKLRIKKNDVTLLAEKHIEFIHNWIIHPSTFSFFQWKDLVYMVPQDLQNEMEFLRTSLNIMHMGTPVATRKHSKFIPEQALALSTKIAKNNFPQIDLELNDALKYLRKDTLDIQGNNKGHALISFEDISLGWINLLENRSNNMYPTAWRIRMHIP